MTHSVAGALRGKPIVSSRRAGSDSTAATRRCLLAQGYRGEGGEWIARSTKHVPGIDLAPRPVGPGRRGGHQLTPFSDRPYFLRPCDIFGIPAPPGGCSRWPVTIGTILLFFFFAAWRPSYRPAPVISRQNRPCRISPPPPPPPFTVGLCPGEERPARYAARPRTRPVARGAELRSTCCLTSSVTDGRAAALLFPHCGGHRAPCTLTWKPCSRICPPGARA